MALQHSRGAYIAIPDSDDAWMPSLLGVQVELLERRPDVDIVTGKAWYLGGPSDGQTAAPSPDTRPDLRRLLEDETAVFIVSVFRRRVSEALAKWAPGSSPGCITHVGPAFYGT